MVNQEHEDVIVLIPAFALNSLDPEEVDVVRYHLAQCQTCQKELKAYEAVVDVMPLGAPMEQPAPALKNRLMAQIGKTVPVETPPSEAASPDRGWRQRLNDALQSFFAGPVWRPVGALIIIALVLSNIFLWQQLDEPDPNAWRRITLTGTDEAPLASGIIYISSDGLNGTIIVDQLPQLGQEEQYQLWLILDGQRTSGAVFSVDADGYRGLQIESQLPLEDYESFGITIEPAGGSPQPTGERVLGYNL